MQYVCLQVPSYEVGWRQSMLAAAAGFAGHLVEYCLHTLCHRKEACVNVKKIKPPKKKQKKYMVVVQQIRVNQFWWLGLHL